jgi:hypothetical protein
MKALLRTFLYLSLIVWVGAEIFFPIVAAIAFNTLRPNSHMAGTIVCHLLGILHTMGLASGTVALAVLALAPLAGVYKPRRVAAPIALLLLMIGLTLYSHFVVLPAMNEDRIAAGGSIDEADPNNPSRVDFMRLHERGEHVEAAILLLGLATVALGAGMETTAIKGPQTEGSKVQALGTGQFC